jgi:hypothetical protein
VSELPKTVGAHILLPSAAHLPRFFGCNFAEKQDEDACRAGAQWTSSSPSRKQHLPHQHTTQAAQLRTSARVVAQHAERATYGGEKVNKQHLVRGFAISTVTLLGLLLSNSIFADAGGRRANEVGSMGPVPKAQCGRSDRTESGLQGQTTSWERFSGDSELGYNCNLELVGQFQGEGAFSQDGPAYFGHCAYMATENDPAQKHPGIVVIDVSDPTNPQATAYLDETAAGLNPHENLKVNQTRGLLALAQSGGPNFAVYDLNVDCAHPKLASTFDVPNSKGHMGGWAEDGKTYYIGQSFRGVPGILPIIDVTDPYNAKWLLNWAFTSTNPNGRPHDLSTNADGTRMYAGQPGNFGAASNNSSFGPDGLVILDTSDIEFRVPNPQIRVVSTLFWSDQGQAEQMLPFFSHGRSYVISTDESGGQAGVGGLPAACDRGASPYGYSNVVDITDETKPRIVSKIMLEVHDPRNCTKFLDEPQEVGGGLVDYSTERCALDRPNNPTMAACGSRGTGTRVYDIRDPLHPAEIAYWKGPAPRKAFLPGSGSWSPDRDQTVAKQSGLARFVKVPAANGKGHELNLWIVGDANGFQVLRFTDDFLQSNPGKAIHAEALGGD